MLTDCRVDEHEGRYECPLFYEQYIPNKRIISAVVKKFGALPRLNRPEQTGVWLVWRVRAPAAGAIPCRTVAEITLLRASQSWYPPHN
jgi:hypothetical protein